MLYGAKGQVTVKYKNRYGRQRSVHHRATRASSRACSAATPTPSRDWSREQIEGYMREVPCPACGGARLQAGDRSPSRSASSNISEVCDLSIGESAKFLAGARADRARAA